MRWRFALGGIAVLVLAVVGVSSSRPQLAERPLILTGWVRISTSEDGLTTVVTVAPQQPTPDRADVVDRAFRLQHVRPQHLEYEGPATVTHALNQLVVSINDSQGWRFPVAGRQVVAGSAPAAYPEIAVLGLSRHWGAGVRLSHDEVVTTLLAGTCDLGAGSGSCDSCATGGGGESSCGVQCGDNGCSAECAPGQFACCNCPRSCVCCAPRIDRAASATSR